MAADDRLLEGRLSPEMLGTEKDYAITISSAFSEDFWIFRQQLAEKLRFLARQRRELANEQAEPEAHFRIAYQLEHLATDARNVNPHIFAIYQKMLLSRNLGRVFGKIEHSLFSCVGVSFHPTSATALVRRMVWRVLAEAKREHKARSL